jgi:DNA replication protein DnaC
METIVYEASPSPSRFGEWVINRNIGRAATSIEIAELKRRNAEHITPEDLPGTPEFVANQQWLAGKPDRDALEKEKRNAAAKADMLAKKARRESVIISVANDYPGISQARRTVINQAVLSAYTKNYIFSGPGGVGKTTLMKAIAQLDVIDGKRALWTTGTTWESDIRRNAYADFEDKSNLPISAEGLSNCRPALICFDEVDHMSRTEFILNPFCSLLNELIKGNHQVVMTTNLNRTDFETLMGASIMWRLLQQQENNGRGGLGCTWVRFDG